MASHLADCAVRRPAGPPALARTTERNLAAAILPAVLLVQKAVGRLWRRQLETWAYFGAGGHEIIPVTSGPPGTGGSIGRNGPFGNSARTSPQCHRPP